MTRPARLRLLRGADRGKDQSYVLHMLDQRELRPRGAPDRCADASTRCASARTRSVFAPRRSPTARTCASSRRREVAATSSAIASPSTPAASSTPTGSVVGEVDAVELVTVGQRRGLGALGIEQRSYAVDVDVAAATVDVGSADDLLIDHRRSTRSRSSARPSTGRVLAQCSAHGDPRAAFLDGTTLRGTSRSAASRRGQSIAFYDLTDTELLGGATAA